MAVWGGIDVDALLLVFVLLVLVDDDEVEEFDVSEEGEEFEAIDKFDGGGIDVNGETVDDEAVDDW